MALAGAIAAAAGARDVADGPDVEEPEGGSTAAGRGPRVARFGGLRVLKGLSKADLSWVVSRSRKRKLCLW